MAINDIAIRFTENKYATKNEVRVELKTPLVDSFWSGITAYRSEFYKTVDLKSIQKNPYFYCECNSIVQRETRLKEALKKYESSYAFLYQNQSLFNSFARKSKIEILNDISAINNLVADDKYIRMIVDNQIQISDEKYSILPNYLKALQKLEGMTFTIITIDSLAPLYGILTNQGDNLTSFIRNDELDDKTILINKIYNSAPLNMLEGFIDKLFEFVQTSTIDPITKSFIAYYYMSYIKPFDKYNEEMALLLAKIILSNEASGQSTFFLPYENIYRDADLNKMINEVQKTNDITYLLDNGFNSLEKTLLTCFERIDALKGGEIEEDYYSSKEEQTIEEKPFVSSLDDIKDKSESSPFKEETKAKKEEKPIVVVSRPSIKIKANRISEEEALALEEDLLENDPCLKKGQAKFLAKHNTLGKRYTIQQYKKYIGCVYETARTAMDSLVELGYYRLEMVKNKKVYTPVDLTK